MKNLNHVRYEMLKKKMADQRRYQSPQGFTVPRPSRCKDYGHDFPVEKLRPWERCGIAVCIAGVILVCMLAGRS